MILRNDSYASIEERSVFKMETPGVEMESKTDEKPATFEDVVVYLGFGKFNVLLIALTTVGMWCNIFETTNMSYIFTSAQCDLDLSLQDKSYLNSASYTGMISSALIWGYLGDTLGRKKILVVGFLLDGLSILASAFSQNIVTLLVCKFLGGCIINGPYAALTTYLSEFHSSKYRPKIQLYFGSMISFGLIVLPLLAWVVLVQPWDFQIFNYSFHSWNVFLFFCSFPAFISAVCFLFLPESPKFLMTSGKNKAAMKIFQKVYSINTGKPPETFPIKELVDERKNEKNEGTKTKSQVMREGFSQIKPLFEASLIKKLILVCLIEMFILQSQNMIRLWTPQIFQAFENYKDAHNGTSTHLCNTLDTLRGKTSEGNTTGICLEETEHSSVYINSLIVSSVNMVGYAVTGTIINALGKKRLLIISETIAAAVALGLYFAVNEVMTTALIACFTSIQLITAMVILNVTVDVFPTTLRTLTVSVVLMVARIGIIGGNLLFSYLLSIGCALPFSVVSCIALASVILCFFVPNTENKALE